MANSWLPVQAGSQELAFLISLQGFLPVFLPYFFLV